MKKMTNKLIAIVLAMTLVLSMSGVAFADIDSIAAEPAEKTVYDAAVKAKAVKGVKKIKPMSEDVDTLTIKTMATALTAEPDYDVWTLEPYTYGDAIVTATTTGWVWFDYIVEGSAEDTVNIYLFESTESENGYVISPDGGSAGGDAYDSQGGVYVTKGTSYYLYFETPESNTGNLTLNICAKMYSSMNRDLPAYTNVNQYMISSGLNNYGSGYSDIYYKVIPKKTGLMTVNLKNFDAGATTGKITLYNKNKVALSQSVTYSSAKASTKAYFGVKKGVTYYIRVQNCCGSSGKYGVRYGITAYTDRVINTYAKAKSLTKGTKVKTLFTANNATETDTYKIYNPKKQTLKFTVNTQNIRSGNITVKVYNKNGKQIGQTQTIYSSTISKPYTITYSTTSGKASAGTYYIKLIKGAKASGQYSIVWNK